MSNKKQTAVDFYRKHLMALVSNGETDFKTETEIFNQAKKMHKEEHRKTANDVRQTIFDQNYESFEQYYKETYENG